MRRHQEKCKRKRQKDAADSRLNGDDWFQQAAKQRWHNPPDITPLSKTLPHLGHNPIEINPLWQNSHTQDRTFFQWRHGLKK